MNRDNLIKELLKYNPRANIRIIANNHIYKNIDICFGDSEGCSKENCEVINIIITETMTCENDENLK